MGNRAIFRDDGWEQVRRPAWEGGCLALPTVPAGLTPGGPPCMHVAALDGLAHVARRSSTGQHSKRQCNSIERGKALLLHAATAASVSKHGGVVYGRLWRLCAAHKVPHPAVQPVLQRWCALRRLPGNPEALQHALARALALPIFPCAPASGSVLVCWATPALLLCVYSLSNHDGTCDTALCAERRYPCSPLQAPTSCAGS